MKIDLPRWAIKKASQNDYKFTETAYRNGSCRLIWPIGNTIRIWAKQQGWPTSWMFFKTRFIKKVFENESNFALALQQSGLIIMIPLESYQYPESELKIMDKWYNNRKDMDELGMRPIDWGFLVESLREIRRATEAGVKIDIDNQTLASTSDFFTWANSRYPLLAEGNDSWYGDDKS